MNVLNEVKWNYTAFETRNFKFLSTLLLPARAQKKKYRKILL